MFIRRIYWILLPIFFLLVTGSSFALEQELEQENPAANNPAFTYPDLEILLVQTDKESYKAGDDIVVTAFVNNASPKDRLDVAVHARSSDWVPGGLIETQHVLMEVNDTVRFTITIPTKTDTTGPKILGIQANGTAIDDPSLDTVTELMLVSIIFPDEPHSPVQPVFLIGVIAIFVIIVVGSAMGLKRGHRGTPPDPSSDQ